MVNTEKQERYKAITATIILGLILLLIPFSSGLEKTFTPLEDKITLSEGAVSKGEIRLVDYNPFCFVGSCYMYLEINDVDGNYVNLQDYKTYDALQTKTMTRNKGYEYYDSTYSWTEVQRQYICDIKDYQTKQGEECYKNVEVIKTGKWLPLDYTKGFTTGKTKIRLKVDVNAGETVDVVPVINGIELKEWAAFTGIIRYEYYSTGNDNGAWLDSTKWAAQSFTIGTVGTNEDFDVKGISVMLQCLDGGVYTFYAHIYSAPPNLTSCITNCIPDILKVIFSPTIPTIND